MDWLEFIQKSEWPLIVGGALVMFRKPLADLISGLRPTKFRGFGIDAEFEIRLQKAEELTREAAFTLETVPAIKKGGAPSGAEMEAAPELLPSGEPETHAPGRISSGMGRYGTRQGIRQAYTDLSVQLRNIAANMAPHAPAPASDLLAAKIIGFGSFDLEALSELQDLVEFIDNSDRRITAPEELRVRDVATRLRTRAEYLFGDWHVRQKKAASSAGGSPVGR